MTWEEYALELAITAAKKSKDPWQKVGCCLLREDNTIAGLGFNGFIAGMKEDWSDRDARRPFIVHAEINALAYCKKGEPVLAAVTLLPCNGCLKELALYGVKKIIYKDIYEFDPSTIEHAHKYKIELKQIK